MGKETDEKEFLKLLKEQNLYKQNLIFLQWDTHVNIPNKGLEERLESIGFISEKLQQLNTSKKMKYFIDTFKEEKDNSLLRQIALECESIYEKDRKIPNQLHKEFVMFRSKSESIWQEAKKTSDFSLFQPYLEKMVYYNQQFTDYWGYDHDRYDALLQNYEPGITTKTIDQVFPELRKSLTHLLSQINGSNQYIDEDKIKGFFPVEDQKAFSLALLSRIGFNHQAGRLDTSVHPYTFAFHKNDVRITTRYNPTDFRQSAFSALHEGGHALYEQNFSDDLVHTPLAEVSSMGMHESQALLWENFICGSKGFWGANFDLFKKYAPKDFQDIKLDEFYQTSHKVEASYIRVNADEVTYPLHIMIRYELEKALLNDDIKVQDLPQIWNEKMKEYLGVEPKTDREGVLQDIHWASGDFGYFPSYVLGMMYAAQIHQTLKKELNLEELIKHNDLTSLKQWLTQNIYEVGKRKKPLEILETITNEALNPGYLTSYLNDKYSKVYGF